MDHHISLYLNNFNKKLRLIMLRKYFSFFLTGLFLIFSCNQITTNKDSKIETEKELIERALKIHKNVLTLQRLIIHV